MGSLWKKSHENGVEDNSLFVYNQKDKQTHFSSLWNEEKL